MLRDGLEHEHRLHVCERLSDAKDHLKQFNVDVVILDLGLPDAEGLDAFTQLNALIPDVPVVIMTGTHDENMAITAVKAGAQDYIVKGLIDTPTLGRSIRYAIERKRAQRQASFFQKIAETAMYGFVMTEIDKKIVYVNKALSDMLGEPGTEKMIGKLSLDYFSDESRQLMEKEVLPQLMKQGYWSGEMDLRTKDGRIIHTIQNCSIIRDDQGEPIYIGNFIIDITIRKEIEQALRQSEERFRNLYYELPVAYQSIDGKGCITMVNPTWLNMLEFKEEEVVGKPLIDFIAEESREVYLENGSKCKGCDICECEFTMMRSDGRKILVNANGRSVGAVKHCILNDITVKRRINDIIIANEKRLDSIINGSSLAIFVMDKDHKITHWNSACEKLTGYPADKAIGSTDVWKAFYPHKRPVLSDLVIEGSDMNQIGNHYQTFRASTLAKGGIEAESFIPVPDAAHGKWISLSASPLRDKNGDVIGAVETITDITILKSSVEKLRKLSSAIEQSNSAVMITDKSGMIEYVNSKFIELTGYEYCEIIGKNPRILSSGFTSDEQYRDIWKRINVGEEWQGEIYNKKKTGDLFWLRAVISPLKDDIGEITHFICVYEDITRHKEYEKRLIRQANFDNLTELPNRILAFDRLAQAIARAKREKSYVAVMVIDLDRFKIINETLGHLVGDELLVEAARRLIFCVRGSDTVARLGGDEFFVILPDLEDISHATIVAKKILDAFTVPFLLSGQEHYITASIGVSFYPNDGDEPHILLRNADAAMYDAKEKSRNTFRFFKKELNEQVMERLNLEGYLRHALTRKEFQLNYQPILDIYGKFIAVEALIRWHNSDLGNVTPDRFIPLAEDTGLILPIGEWVLRKACQEIKMLNDEVGMNLRLAVNVSTRQFKTPEFIDIVKQALRESKLPAYNLELEITESLLLEDAPLTNSMMEEFNNMGVRLSLDDFGTGYSALGYLKKFPFSSLKIDRSFTRDITIDAQDAALVTAIISMAHNLGLTVIGEGVETEEQLEFLRFKGCDWVQGYYFSPALNFEKLRDMAMEYQD
jgi:diguanylate cyclase (GGDEF)-like protein/PAS domain S-box-containing protein